MHSQPTVPCRSSFLAILGRKNRKIEKPVRDALKSQPFKKCYLGGEKEGEEELVSSQTNLERTILASGRKSKRDNYITTLGGGSLLVQWYNFSLLLASYSNFVNVVLYGTGHHSGHCQ